MHRIEGIDMRYGHLIKSLDANSKHMLVTLKDTLKV